LETGVNQTNISRCQDPKSTKIGYKQSMVKVLCHLKLQLPSNNKDKLWSIIISALITTTQSTKEQDMETDLQRDNFQEQLVLSIQQTIMGSTLKTTNNGTLNRCSLSMVLLRGVM